MGSYGHGASDRDGLIHAYDEEENAVGGFGLTDLAEDSDEDDAIPMANGNGKTISANVGVRRSLSERERPTGGSRKSSPLPR